MDGRLQLGARRLDDVRLCAYFDAFYLFYASSFDVQTPFDAPFCIRKWFFSSRWSIDQGWVFSVTCSLSWLLLSFLDCSTNCARCNQCLWDVSMCDLCFSFFLLPFRFRFVCCVVLSWANSICCCRQVLLYVCCHAEFSSCIAAAKKVVIASLSLTFFRLQASAFR